MDMPTLMKNRPSSMPPEGLDIRFQLMAEIRLGEQQSGV